MATLERTPPPRRRSVELEPRLPPGPRLPRILQTAGFMLGSSPWFIDACRRRFGDVVTFRTLFDSEFVMVFHPALVKELFQGPGEQLRAGEANAMLGPVVGERSVLLLDGAEHLRHRRLMLPPFHGRRMQAFAEAMRRAADLEIDAWPVGEPFALLPSMQSLTLRVIMQAVFGYEPGPPRRSSADGCARWSSRWPGRGRWPCWRRCRCSSAREAALNDRFAAARRDVDEVLYAEIARRRALGRRGARRAATTCSPRCSWPRTRTAERLSDREVRDELMTLLLAGHETTATGLAWCFDLRAAHAGRARAGAASATSGTSTRWSRRRCGSGR